FEFRFIIREHWNVVLEAYVLHQTIISRLFSSVKFKILGIYKADKFKLRCSCPNYQILRNTFTWTEV
ncbi:unnamed protein product, partial [Allacma fusca]